ncbi:hypothetical protein M413DRAFT_30193 [Hebeloma cylindrosporum]|uniref:Uncharacterized protein n=1 Tax=Hebeloma cylindrosporum TaxID=76867 RepID=A0A0C2XKR0_HEBCY|nr:hypothetical protein M413DRAFT_30193 [Hebeloma cylindrosporum h7]
MAPPSWATEEQLTFLHGYISIFADHTAKETQSKFWPRLNEDWFSRWPELDVLIKDGRLPPQARGVDPDGPEDADAINPRYQLTPEECELYGAAIEKRKQRLQNWIHNNTRKMAGTSKISNTRVNTSALGLLNPRKRQRVHQEQEVYHSLYKDKLEKLVKEAMAEQLPEIPHGTNGSDEDKSDNDSGGDDSTKDKRTEPRSIQKLRALRMKIRREVRAEAWANETEEVRCQVKKAIMREREEIGEINGEEGKVGLERSPASREL